MFDVKAYIRSLGNPARIIHLDLSYKNITELDEDIFQGLTQLKKLHLNGNQLSTLPLNLFGNLTQLKVLFLSLNKLTNLPPNLFENLTQLEILSLSENQLTSLPPKLFENVTQLKRLFLDDNQLNTIPLSIFNLTQLGVLDLDVNRLNRSEQIRITEWAGENNVELTINNQNPPQGRTSPQRSPQRRTSPQRSPQRTSPQRSPQRRTSPTRRGSPTRRTSPQRSPQRTSPQRSPQQPFDVTCINDDDVLGIDDFTKGHKEFEAERRVIILNEGNSREGNCFGLKTIILAMMNTQEGKPTLGPWRAMNQMGSNATNRYFKLPYPNVWIDLEGMKKLLDGWKVLRLKYLREERIGSFFGVGTLHGHKEKIYTLAKVNSKYQGKNKPLSYKEVDNHTRIFLEIDENFIHLFSE